MISHSLVPCLTNEGSESNKPCVFPFIYMGVKYETCTMKNDLSKQWCSTKVDSNGHHTWGHWGYCNEHCPSMSLDKKKLGLLWLKLRI